MIKFVYNNNKYAFIKYFSFEIMQKYSSRMFFEKFTNKKIKIKIVKKHVKHLIKLFLILKNNIFVA